MDIVPKRRSGIRFINEEDKYIRIGIEKFGFSWSTILRHLAMTLILMHVVYQILCEKGLKP